jgi:hypothetical protein
MLRLSYLAALVGLGLAAASCGLIDSSVTNFKLRFPPQDFQIDTADWHLTASTTVPQLSCSVGCESAAATFCSGGACRSTCDAGTQSCQATVPIALRNDIDLATEAPGFQDLADQPVISVTIDDVYFDIRENTLNVATPTLYVYFGPATATAPTDSGVEVVGIIDPVNPGFTGRAAVRFEGTGRQVMKRYMDDFHTPFRVFVSGEITVRAGQPTPQGRLVGSVQAEAHAGIG